MSMTATGTVVIVNGDPVQLHYASGILKEDGHKVFRCECVEQALAILDEDSPPDIIITDLHLSGIDGWRFCRLLRSSDFAAFNAVPILVTSPTYSGEHVEQTTVQLGADAFLPLPFEASSLRFHVRSLLDGKNPSLPAGVLIVDDSMTVCEMLRNVFEARGYKVYAALTGEEGLTLFREHSPEVVLLDYHLPDIKGEQILPALKQSLSSAVIILMTADTTPAIATRAMQMGADGYVRKPFDPDYLINLSDSVRQSRALLSIEERLEERTKELRHNERRFRLLFEKMLNGFAFHEIICDENGKPCDYRFLEINPAFERLTGLTRDHVLGRTVLEVLPDMEPSWVDIFGSVALTGKPAHFEKYSRAMNKYFEVTAYSPKKGFFATTFDDVTGRKQAENQIQRLVYYDSLTSLPNRLLLHDHLEHALAQAARDGRIAAVLSCDLDHFKVVNDTLGHTSGDRLLKAVSARLATRVRRADTLSRMGGDEFVIILSGVHRLEDVAHAAQHLLDGLTSPFEVDGQEVFVSASIGIALYPCDGDDADSLLKNADIAMYHAKEAGRNCYRFYAAEMNVKSEQRMAMETSLRYALERKEFFLHYQPWLDLKTGRITGMEALLRWQHPERGVIPPDMFIPMTEETGLILPIGEWVLHTACLQLKALHEAGFPALRMAVNLSGRQLKHYNLAGTVARVLAETGVDPTCLELELTESSIMENIKETTTKLHAIREMGITLAIDDFGTGYSSLSYLKRFPIDKLKIDRSFVCDIPTNPDDVAITRAIIAMARSLKLKVIGEGVETEEQMAFLREHGCDEIQGYHISRPVPAEELQVLLQSM
ncbi:MAG: PAS/PAC sensor-containing diguanylate [Geobacteraceae bacterium]|nr:MAG: PAS/PAC sensor-containing diguanylate [Geobacteraceae bacterium]